MYRILVTTVFEDYILKNKFNSRGEAEKFERQNLEKLKKACNYPVGDWKIIEVTGNKAWADLIIGAMEKEL